MGMQGRIRENAPYNRSVCYCRTVRLIYYFVRAICDPRKLCKHTIHVYHSIDGILHLETTI